MDNKSENSFVLKGSNENFIQRQKNVFDQLNSLQSEFLKSPIEEMDVEEPSASRKSNRSTTKQFRGKESIFKRPQNPITKNYMKTIPDFKKNPHKWKKYSLADVKDEDMSDRSNTKTALSFINELKNRNTEEDYKEKTSNKPEKIIFRKIHDKDEINIDEEKKISFKSSKVVMPEYVVGQKVKKEKKNKNARNGNSSQLKLDHLYEED